MKMCRRPHKAGHVKCTRPKGHYQRHEARQGRSWFQWGGNRALRGTMTMFRMYGDHLKSAEESCD